jgi:hypothetical protein
MEFFFSLKATPYNEARKFKERSLELKPTDAYDKIFYSLFTTNRQELDLL